MLGPFWVDLIDRTVPGLHLLIPVGRRADRDQPLVGVKREGLGRIGRLLR